MALKKRQPTRPMAVRVLTGPWLPVVALIVLAAVIGASFLWFESQEGHEREADVSGIRNRVVETVVAPKEVVVPRDSGDDRSTDEAKQPVEKTKRSPVDPGIPGLAGPPGPPGPKTKERVIPTSVVKREVEIAGETAVEPTARTPFEREQVVAVAPAATAAPVATAAPRAMAVENETIAEEAIVVVTVVVESEVQPDAALASRRNTRHPLPTAIPGPKGAPGLPGQPGAPGSPGRPSRSGSPAQPSATFFQNYPRGTVNVTAYDDTSTFSLDTDRTSYQLALNWARAGYEVDPVSVRAEEWINAFDYGYDYPKHPDNFGITTDIIDHPLHPGRHLARVAFQAPDVRVEKPLNVTLVLDASGSMADGNRIEIAREASYSIRSSLRSDDRISIVQFTDHIVDELVVFSSNPDNNDVEYSIRGLVPRGSTNVQAGLNLGVELAHKKRQSRPDALNYIVLMSDGVANVDATDPFAILESAHDPQSSNPLRIISIGVGINNYNDLLLEQLAQHGNGWYRYLSNSHDARSLFSRESWLALSVPFADQTRAQITWDAEHVAEWRLIGYENRVTSDESFTKPLKKFAEIPAGAATTVFYELEFNSDYLRRADKPAIGDVELRWVEPETGLSVSQHAAIVDGNHRETQMLKFGTIVALAADLYSALDEVRGNQVRTIHEYLNELQFLLDGHETRFKETDAYHDFRFLLNHITDDVPPPAPSGYSR